MPTTKQIDAILPYLEPFEPKEFSPGKWSDPVEILGLFHYDQRVTEFLKALYDHGWIDRKFDWKNWDAGTEYAKHPDKIDAADASTIQKLFTAHVRTDRFCEGHLARLFESGVIVRMLRRLRDLRNSATSSDSAEQHKPLRH